jgi:effector-binding domain-containing protein
MPLEEIHAVLTTADPEARNELIGAHLQRLEMTLARTQQAAASLRDLLQPPADAVPVVIEHRRMPATPAAAVTDVIERLRCERLVPGRGRRTARAAGSSQDHSQRAGRRHLCQRLFSHERGEATVFLPCDGPVRATGRVTAVVVPKVELALTVHLGPHSGEIDRAYGSLATYVTDHALAVEGPIREYCPVGSHETSEEDQWRTEIGWPIFDTGHAAHEPTASARRAAR